MIKTLYPLLAIILTACQASVLPASTAMPVLTGSASTPTTPSPTPGAELPPGLSLIAATPSPAPRPSPLLAPSLTPSPPSSSSQRLDLVGQLGGTTRAAFVQGQYAYLYVGLKLAILDISDPTMPEAVGAVMLPDVGGDYLNVDMYAADHYAYVSGGKGLYIVDVSEPAAPTPVGFYQTPGRALSVMVSSSLDDTPTVTYAYLTYQKDDDESGGILTLNVSDPTTPLKVGSYETPGVPRDVSVVADSEQIYAYVAVDGPCGPDSSGQGIQCAGGGLRVLDISKAAAPSEIAFLRIETPVSQLVIRDGYAYVAGSLCLIDRGCDGALQVIDISTPTRPDLVGLYRIPATSVAVTDGYAYTTANGLYVLDVSESALPTYTDAPTYVASEPGLWGQVAAVVGGYAYIVDREGLRVVSVAEPEVPTQVAFYDPPGPADARDVAATERYVYVADWGAGLSVVDTSDPTAPSEVGRNNHDHPERIWWVNNDYVYLGGEWASLRVIDITLPRTPAEVGTYTLAENQHVWGVMGGWVYLANAEGLQVIDLTDPTRPSEVGLAIWPQVWNTLDAALADGYAYVAMYEEGWQVLDVSNPAAAVELGFASGRSGPTIIADGYAYPTFAQGMQVIDLTDPVNPIQRGVYRAPGCVFEVAAVANGLAYVIVEGRLHIVDVSNPDDPQEVSAYGEPYTVHALAADDTLLYLLRGMDGIEVLDVSDPTQPVRVGRDVPQAWSLNPTADIKIVGNHAYVYDKSEADLHVIDISEAATPVEVAWHQRLGQVWAVEGTPTGLTYAYLFDHDRNVRVVELSDPATAVEIGFYDTPGWPGEMSVVSERLYLGTDHGLLVLDVSDPANPVEVDGFESWTLAGPVQVSRGYAYIPTSRYALKIFDLADPARPRLAGTFANLRPGQIGEVTAADGRAYVQLQVQGPSQETPSLGLQIIDVTDPTRPLDIGFYQPQDAELVSVVGVQGNYLFTADSYQNLHMVDLRDPARPHETGVYALPAMHGVPLAARAVAAASGYLYVASGEAGLIVLRVNQ